MTPESIIGGLAAHPDRRIAAAAAATGGSATEIETPDPSSSIFVVSDGLVGAAKSYLSSNCGKIWGEQSVRRLRWGISNAGR
jgi:hypothetical protein